MFRGLLRGRRRSGYLPGHGRYRLGYRVCGLADHLGALDRHQRPRHVSDERALRTGRQVVDLVHDIHALDDLAEYRVTPGHAVLVAYIVETRIVDHIDEELRGRRIGVGAARGGHGAAQVRETVV